MRAKNLRFASLSSFSSSLSIVHIPITNSNFMSIISYKHKFIYALSPRTASTATAAHLVKNMGAEWIPKKHITDDDGFIIVDKKHSTFEDLVIHNILPEETVDSFLTFVTVRNPFDSLYSVWYKKRETYVKLIDDPDSWVHKKPGYVEDMYFIRDHSFSDWIISKFEDLSKDNKSRHLSEKFLKKADRVLKFEELNDELKKLFDEYNIPYPGEIPVLNKTVGRSDDYRVHYNEEARKVVEKTYDLDLESFGYSF